MVSKNLSGKISWVVQCLRLCLPMQVVWVQSLVGGLRSSMPPGQKKQTITQKQDCNKFNKRLLKKTPSDVTAATPGMYLLWVPIDPDRAALRN